MDAWGLDKGAYLQEDKEVLWEIFPAYTAWP